MMLTGWYGSSRNLTPSPVNFTSSAPIQHDSVPVENELDQIEARTENILEILQARRVYNRRGGAGLREHPSDSDLCRAYVFVLCELLNPTPSQREGLGGQIRV